jgi:hypothetical protein
MKKSGANLNQQLGLSGGKRVIYKFNHLIAVPSAHRQFYVLNGKNTKLIRLNERRDYGDEEFAVMEGRQQVALVVAAAETQYGVDYPIEAYEASRFGLSEEFSLFSLANTRHYPAMLPYKIQEGDVVLINHDSLEPRKELDSFRNFDVLSEKLRAQDRASWKIFSIRDKNIYGYFRNGRWHNFGQWIFLRPGSLLDAIKLGIEPSSRYSLSVQDLASRPYLIDGRPWEKKKAAVKIGIAQVVKDFEGFGPIPDGSFKKGDWVYINPRYYYLFENDALSIAEQINQEPDPTDSLATQSTLHVFSIFDILCKLAKT